MREDQRLDKSQWGERGRSHARRKAAVSATEQMNEAPRVEGLLADKYATRTQSGFGRLPSTSNYN